MYIWDYDKATEEMKPQVSCFTLISTPPLPVPHPRRWRNRSGGSVYRLVNSVIFTENPFGVHRNHCVHIGQVLL